MVRPLEAYGPAGLRRPGRRTGQLRRVASSEEPGLLAGAVSKESNPELSAILREQLAQLLEGLYDPALRQIAEWRMEGASNAEIARRLGRAVRTVERKVELIRLTWEKIGDDPAADADVVTWVAAVSKRPPSEAGAPGSKRCVPMMNEELPRPTRGFDRGERRRTVG